MRCSLLLSLFSRHSEASRSVEYDVRDYMLQSFSFSEIVHRVERVSRAFSARVKKKEGKKEKFLWKIPLDN
jgi:DNA-binding NarL/FixJ family response regulator